jgi:hypothetical protein
MDLEGDGDLDVVTANRSASNLAIFLNNGDGTLQPATFMDGNGSQETSCVPADANNDGIMDLFVGALLSEEIILLLGDGEGGLTFSAKVDAQGAPWMLATGDVNGDGNADVVASNSFANNAAVVLGDGQGGLSSSETYPVGNFTLAIDLGDLDGDSDLDLVTSNYSSGTWSIYENDGTGVFMNLRTLNAMSAGSCATLHDRDNDGDLDITGIDEIDDVIFLFENESPVSVAGDGIIPSRFELSQNYPNPFNPATTISFSLPASGFTTLEVFDLLGRSVATPVRREMEAGNHEVNFRATGLPSGVYFYRLTQGPARSTRKLVLAR